MEQKLFNGNCLSILPTLPKESVDLILTDPPYNISKPNGFRSMGRSGIDFGEWDKEADLTSYLDYCRSILTKDGSIIIFNDWKNLGMISEYCEQLGFVTKDLLRLEKTNPMPRNRDRRYITDYELAIWLTQPKAKWTFNRIDAKYQRPKFVHSIDKGLHPTQKSLGLMEDLVKIHTNKHDTVLDPFMGSGTTGLACKNLERSFIGIEMDNSFFNIVEERLS